MCAIERGRKCVCLDSLYTIQIYFIESGDNNNNINGNNKNGDNKSNSRTLPFAQGFLGEILGFSYSEKLLCSTRMHL